MAVPPTFTDQELGALAVLAASSDEAWNRIVDALYPAIYAYPRRRCRTVVDTPLDENALCDWVAWLYPRLRKSLTRYDPTRGARFSTFLSTVLRTRLFDWLRHRRAAARRDGLDHARNRDVESLASEGAPSPLPTNSAGDGHADPALSLQTLPWLGRMALLLPDFLEKVSHEDLEELARRHGWTVEQAGRALIEACRMYQSDADLIDLLVPPTGEGDAAKSRLNRLQQARSRAKKSMREHAEVEG